VKFKIWNLIGIVAASLILAVGLVGCAAGTTDNNPASTGSTPDSAAPAKADGGGPINVVSREDGSGTRSAFVELFEVQIEGANGKKVDATTTSAVITNSTSVMLTTVAGDLNAIGYISLGSLNNTVKALNIDGTEATAANVKSGSYKISRPFNIVTKGEVSAAAQDFINFIMSKEGQKVIVDNSCIAIDDAALAYAKTAGAAGKVVVAGSSSVAPVMEKLKEAYAAVNSAVEIEIQTSDSGTGISSTISGVCDIGMASRELKDTETSEGITPIKIAIDGLAVIVNPDRETTDMSADQVKAIFLGEVTNWKDL
jgi:phosphate transport system substrate-binding protein